MKNLLSRIRKALIKDSGPLHQEQKDGMWYISQERQRQVHGLGYHTFNDRAHTQQELAYAAAAYALPEVLDPHIKYRPIRDRSKLFPWKKYWKPSPNDRIKELSKSGALIAAEIDRILLEQDLERAKSITVRL